MRKSHLTLLFLAFVHATGVWGGEQAEAAAGFSPEEALARLKNGNLRFAEGKSKHPRLDSARRAATVQGGQHPLATIIGCSDSREPIELLCDQGIGDCFVIRVAGNVCSTDEIASAEYAIGHLATPLCVVMGHTGCGAVTAAATGAQLHGHLPALIQKIGPAIEKAKKDHPGQEGQALVPLAIETNVWQGLENILSRSEEIRKRASEGKVLLVGAIYDLSTGQVKWLGQHPEEKRLLGKEAQPKVAAEQPKIGEQDAAEAKAKEHH